MKYLKHYNENVDKRVIDIEDMMIQFTDSVELDKYNVHLEKSLIIIYLKFNNNIEGIKVLEVVDKIIKRLKRKYEFVYQKHGHIYIDFEKKLSDYNYIKDGFVDTVNRIIDNMFKRMKSYRLTGQIKPTTIYYAENPYKILFRYMVETKSLLINKFLYEQIKWISFLSKDDMNDIILKAVKERLNLQIDSIMQDNLDDDFSSKRLVSINKQNEYGL